MSDYPVVIAGAGPVGLTLAIDLARRGIRSLLVERNRAPLRWPKMERCNARTMEIYRRLGLSERIRAASKFIDVPMDVFCILDLKSVPLAHIRFPSVTEAQAQIARCSDGTLPREPYQLISQYTLEPLLRDVVAGLPEVDVHYGCALTGFEQNADSVTVSLEFDDGRSLSVAGQYLVGTDGGASIVRKQLGVRFEGEGRILALRQILFRSERLFAEIPIGPGRHYIWPHTGMVVQDDLRHFALHTLDVSDAEGEATVRRIVDMDVDIEVLADTRWVQNLLLVDRYSQGRVFLAGDSSHIVI
ncbi:MAG: FAD-dependent monooxygenase, partial [Candidatus Eremiobacteraeota bacterium]|nr:FAD-dependent monooxygenase [Candidatus Eremiobacteraeota bacterium]